MQRGYYLHPHRFPMNAEGAFYTLGMQFKDGTWCGECMSCGTPEKEAPTLLASFSDECSDTYFIRQPETDQEVVIACNALNVCCVNALRYAGHDPKILALLDPSVCDHPTFFSRFSLFRFFIRLRYWGLGT
ncbi:hypothetical protein [Undibacterium flavidum]|uniref:Uncharacterized protein n=1 Tax=Undibacterium flavidum TaxID=2762297 RepID=A0ABR6YBN7_9BURK|nr:hypothetical protein [Undibacterium flavidum]MBC3874045.1 hypothetical protein [Undibacterium flavidum]